MGEPGPIGTGGRAVRQPVPIVTRVAAVNVEEYISGLFLVNFCHARRIRGRVSILELVGELGALLQGRHKCMELAALGDDVAYGSESPFKTENRLAQEAYPQEAYLVLVRPEARRALRGEQFEVLKQLSQAIAIGCQGTNRHESVQVETSEGRRDLMRARIAAEIALYELNHLPIGHPLSVIVKEVGTSGPSSTLMKYSAFCTRVRRC